MDDLDLGDVLDDASDVLMASLLTFEPDTPASRSRRRRGGGVGCLWPFLSLAILAAGVGAGAYLLVHFLP